MPRRTAAIACVLTVAVMAGTPRLVRAAAERPSRDEVLAKAAAYVAEFVARFSNVVAEEHYVQDWKTNGGMQLLHRELTSDFLLTRTSADAPWQAFRDVFAVNGVPVRDRQDRLTRLFINPSPDSIERASALAKESARYNISNVQRTVNQPLFAFIFFQRENQARFQYSIDRQDRDVGESVWIVEYKEVARPTLVRGTNDRDLPARGRVWIDSTSGRIARTELQFEDNLQSTQITVRFAADQRVQIDIPSEMDEQYSVKGSKGRISGKATYARFREFGVKTEERFRPPDTEPR
ncbi:MAG TPA: hypothetical protein VJP86_11960 [Vicinamibacterales bacterium]|nr:hypothetical protein [Vicinamibacterales bacterium]